MSNRNQNVQVLPRLHKTTETADIASGQHQLETEAEAPSFSSEQHQVLSRLHETTEMAHVILTETAAPSFSSEQHQVDIEAIMWGSQQSTLPKKHCCIYKVPSLLRKLNEDAYTPIIVSIGPYHYGDSKLQNMEEIKDSFYKRFVERVGERRLNNLKFFVITSKSRVCTCYSESFKLSEEELVKVILRDAIFIIELFHICFYDRNYLDADDSIYQPWLLSYIARDLLLLENQLPFFFLKELFDKAFLDLRIDIPSFLELTFNFFSSHNEQELEHNDPNISINHFTDLLRIFYLPQELPGPQFQKTRNHILSYSATELLESGVRIKAIKSKCILNLKFSGNVLEIPTIAVEDRTETLFRNMIALEQCHYPCKSYITDYALVFDYLINSSKDVDVLVDKEIIINYLGESGNVAKLFNGMGKEIVRSNFNSDYYDICKRLNDFYRNPCNKKKASLRHDYCKTPWQTVASIAGIFLIILTLVQTISSIIQIA